MKGNIEWLMKNNIVYIICAVIIAFGIFLGFARVSDVILEKSFNTSVSYPSTYNDYEIMDIDSLMGYLGIYPQVKYEEEAIYYNGEETISEPIISNPYEEEMDRLKTELLDNITSGKWVDFPYVKINDTYYFHKSAVNDWFKEMGKEQLEIK